MLELETSDSYCAIKGKFTREHINAIMRPGEDYITRVQMPSFDFQNVAICDSTGIALVIHWWRFATKHNKNICFNNLSDKMLAIMRVSGIDVEDNKLKI